MEPVEQELYKKLTEARKQVEEKIGGNDYRAALETVAQLEEPINAFFEGVMVMVEDENVKNNRVALLLNITKLVEPIADLTKIVQD